MRSDEPKWGMTVGGDVHVVRVSVEPGASVNVPSMLTSEVVYESG